MWGQVINWRSEEMGINGVALDYYQAGYTNNKATKAEAGKSFADIPSQKVVEADKQSG